LFEYILAFTLHELRQCLVASGYFQIGIDYEIISLAPRACSRFLVMVY
jgi:hypothetical protein